MGRDHWDHSLFAAKQGGPLSKGQRANQNSGLSALSIATPKCADATQPQPTESRKLDAAQRRRDLGKFLKAKRSLLKPADVGLSSVGRRRTPGLRREEIAQVAEVGVTWYTWLEQGRNINVSSDIFQRLARVLRLSPQEAAYMYSLAGHTIPEAQAPEGKLRDVLQGLLDAHSWPGVAFDALFDLVAYNDLADSIFRFEMCEGPRGRNQIWRMFMEPDRRQLHVDWPDCARSAVGLLRAAYANRKDDAALLGLVEELRNASAEFEKFWDDGGQIGMHSYAPTGLRLRVSDLGILNFHPIRLGIPMHPGWYVMLLQPADKGTDDALKGISKKSNRS